MLNVFLRPLRVLKYINTVHYLLLLSDAAGNRV